MENQFKQFYVDYFIGCYTFSCREISHSCEKKKLTYCKPPSLHIKIK